MRAAMRFLLFSPDPGHYQPVAVPAVLLAGADRAKPERGYRLTRNLPGDDFEVVDAARRGQMPDPFGIVKREIPSTDRQGAPHCGADQAQVQSVAARWTTDQCAGVKPVGAPSSVPEVGGGYQLQAQAPSVLAARKQFGGCFWPHGDWLNGRRSAFSSERHSCACRRPAGGGASYPTR